MPIRLRFHAKYLLLPESTRRRLAELPGLSGPDRALLRSPAAGPATQRPQGVPAVGTLDRGCGGFTESTAITVYDEDTGIVDAFTFKQLEKWLVTHTDGSRTLRLWCSGEWVKLVALLKRKADGETLRRVVTHTSSQDVVGEVDYATVTGATVVQKKSITSLVEAVARGEALCIHHGASPVRPVIDPRIAHLLVIPLTKAMAEVERAAGKKFEAIASGLHVDNYKKMKRTDVTEAVLKKLDEFRESLVEAVDLGAFGDETSLEEALCMGLAFADGGAYCDAGGFLSIRIVKTDLVYLQLVQFFFGVVYTQLKFVIEEHDKRRDGNHQAPHPHFERLD